MSLVRICPWPFLTLLLAAKQPGHLWPFLVSLRLALIISGKAFSCKVGTVIRNSVDTTVIEGHLTYCELVKAGHQLGKTLLYPHCLDPSVCFWIYDIFGNSMSEKSPSKQTPKQSNHQKSGLKSTGGKKFFFPCVWSLMKMPCFHNTFNESFFIFGFSLG